jgi:rod shape-determining protein MreB
MQEKKVRIGFNDAERIKHIAGSAFYVDDKFENSKVQGYGYNVVEGRHIEIIIPNIEIRKNILDKPIQEIIKAIKKAFEKASPELSEDICKNGLWLTGGGALLKGLDDRIREEIKLSVNIPTEVSPLHTVITGAGTVLDNMDKYRNVLIKRRPMP